MIQVINMTPTVLLLLLPLVTPTPPPTVQAPWGRMQGVRVVGNGGREMDAYYGIPYALPPVGDRRLEKPQPHPGPDPDTLFVADQHIAACPQIKPGIIGGDRETSEDCLALDVYTSPLATVDPARLRPVMVFIHGGGYGLWDVFPFRPSKLVVDGGVTVVTMQYRLGVFGFLSSGDDVLPGNLGLWDQNLAIRWVKDNIQAFGGDPEKITLFGESAGSMSVGLHIVSPHSRGLFQRAILESGSPQTLMTTKGQNQGLFQRVCEACGCQGLSNMDALTCLKRVPGEEFFMKTLPVAISSAIGFAFYPTVDGDFIPAHPRQLLQDKNHVQKNRIGDVDILMGLNSQEGSVGLFTLANLKIPQEEFHSTKAFAALMEVCFDLGLKTSGKSPVLKKAIEFFYRGSNMSSTNPLDTDTVVALYGDCLMTAPIVEWMRYLVALPHSSPRYLYELAHPFNCNQGQLVPGCHHADELLLLFDELSLVPGDSMFHVPARKTLADDEQGLSDAFVGIFSSFATTGNPTGSLKEELGSDWPEFTSENEAYVSIARASHVVNNLGPYKERTALWLQLLPELEAEMTKEQESDERTRKDEL